MSDDDPTVDDCPSSNDIPMLGLGTWENEDPDACATSVETALEMGYRHIDTAQIYGNEESVGAGLAAADVDREEIFLATKVWIDDLDHEGVIETTDESLDRLGVDSVDLMYVHWPSRTYDAEETLAAFNELHADGKIDRIGVSNFEPDQLREAMELSDAPIVANQVECHPLLQQDELREVAAAEGVELVAYSPLARGDVFDVPELQEIADDHDASAAQVSLAWLRQQGVTAIPKATSEAHIRDNWQSLALRLSDDEIDRIESIDQTGRRVDPSFGPWN